MGQGPSVTEFDMLTHIGRGLISGDIHRPHPSGAGPQRSTIWGFRYIYVYALCRRTAKFDVTHTRMGLFLGCHPQRSRISGVLYM